MFVKDNFIHSTYIKPNEERIGKVSLLKSEVIAFDEIPGGTMVFTRNGSAPEITMPHEEVQKALQETVC